AKFQIAGRCADRLIRFVHVQLGVLRAIIHDQVDDHATSTAGAVTGAINLIALDEAPLAARSPVLLEFVQRVWRMILWMLLPLGIGKVDAVGSFEILLLQRRKEFIGDALFRPEAVPPNEKSDDQHE